MPQLDRKSETPLYMQIYNDLKEKIFNGEYPLGGMLPSESKLCSIYGVERATVRRALAIMVDEQKIERIPGLGTKVIDPKHPSNMSKKQTLLFLLPIGLDNSDRIREPFNAKLIVKLEHECSLRGFTLLYKSFSESDTVDDLIHTCNPCGVFYTSSLTLEMYKRFSARGIPIVLLNQSHHLYPSVCLDNRGGVKLVMEHLIKKGHRKIGFISGIPAGQNQVSRYSGYKEALAANSIPFNEEWVSEGAWTIESGKIGARKLLGSNNPPTAIFAANDSMAIGAIMEATNMGFSVPEDISIAGFDNIDQALYISPTLTTVAVDYGLMARSACMLLFEMIEHNDVAHNVNIYIPLKVIKRKSTCRVKQE